MKKLAILTVISFLVCTAFSQERYALTQLTEEPAQQGFPCWSPDGKYLIFSQADMNDSINNGIWRIKLDDMTKELIFRGIAEHPKWSPDNRNIVFDASYGESIQIIPVNGGEPMEFLPDNIKISRGGLPSWSPDGSKVLFKEGKTYFIYVYDFNAGTLTVIYDDPVGLSLPCCWYPDGNNVLIGVREPEGFNSAMWKVCADGSGKEKISGHHDNFYRYGDISPDGQFLAYVTVNIEDRNSKILVMPVEGGKSIEIVAPPGFNEAPAWSPDGKRIAFTSTRSGHFDIWMVEVDIIQLKRN